MLKNYSTQTITSTIICSVVILSYVTGISKEANKKKPALYSVPALPNGTQHKSLIRNF